MFPDPGSLAFSKMAGCSPAPASPMPQFKAKPRKVWALEIEKYHAGAGPLPGGTVTIFFANPKFKPKDVSGSIVSRHLPEKGDFFVVNEHGYQSILPAKVFRETYEPDGC